MGAEAREALARGLAEFKGGIVVVTHDDMLIYQLLQCSWSSGELVVCRDGSVRCDKNFSGYRLQSMKDEVRRAEEAEALAEVVVEQKRRKDACLPRSGRQLTVAKSVSSTYEPAMPPGFTRALPIQHAHDA